MSVRPGQAFKTGADEFLLKKLSIGYSTTGSPKGRVVLGLFESTSTNPPRPDESTQLGGGFFNVSDSMFPSCEMPSCRNIITTLTLPSPIVLKARTRYWIYSPRHADDSYVSWQVWEQTSANLQANEPRTAAGAVTTFSDPPTAFLLRIEGEPVVAYAE